MHVNILNDTLWAGTGSSAPGKLSYECHTMEGLCMCSGSSGVIVLVTSVVLLQNCGSDKSQ